MKLGRITARPWALVRPALAVLPILATFLATPLAAAEPKTPAYLAPKRAISAPDGFAGLCGTYGWACASSAASAVSGAAVLKLADRINRSVNRRTRQISDRAQYRKDEVWALPTARGGDCEDLVLLKKLRLIEAGVPASSLLMATVLDLRGGRHAVLVLRTNGGDLVLDSLHDRIKHWVDTRYTFLKLQNPRSPGSWDAIFAGGRIPIERPTVIAMK
ncbi:MAG: transglutaminase-like cysteine peptidase [Paracoccaceae bacterium]